jgi:hypothetical protein
MFKPLAHVWPGHAPPAKADNRLYSSWVTDVSIQRLLETTDLNGAAAGLPSALCSDVLDEILANAFKISGTANPRPWIGRAEDTTLCVMLTLTNLRGVPYSFRLIGAEKSDAFGMLNHADVGAFVIGIPPAEDVAEGKPAAGVKKPVLDVRSTDNSDWAFFKVAALATGAFPVGLRARAIQRDPIDYTTGGTVGMVDPVSGNFVIISPDKRFPLNAPFKFWAVDGGTIDNEPLEQARRFLTNNSAEKTDGIAADKAVLLVAPFPNYALYGDDTTTGTLASVLPTLATALVNQARFKPEELAQAHDSTNFARFIVSPDRKNSDGSVPQFAIASGALGGFSGFLDESFRRHDYLLGRRNAQAFLRWNFGLPKSNPIFSNKTFAPKWVVRNAEHETRTLAPGTDLQLQQKMFPRSRHGSSEAGYPIIPLTERMMQPIDIPAADQPKPSRDMLEPLRPAIRNRIDRAVDILVDVDLAELMSGGLFGSIVKKAAKLYGAEVLNSKITKMIGDNLAALQKAFP